METAVIRKRLNTFKSSKGVIRNVSNDVAMEVLRGWESWPGKACEYYREIGLSKMQMVTMIQKAKRLVKSGAVTESEFKELSVPAGGTGSLGLGSAGMELQVEGKQIRFAQVDQLVEFLKKTS